MILLIQKFNIISRIFIFYKQHILAEFLARKDNAVGIRKLFIAHFMCTAQQHMHRCAYDWHKLKRYLGSQNGTIKVGPNSIQVAAYLLLKWLRYNVSDVTINDAVSRNINLS